MTEISSVPPLAVDLDGSLFRGDLMVEAAAALVAANPLNLVRAPLWFLRGRAHAKARIAENAPPPDAARLPYNTELLDWIRAERASGRRIVLATAAARPHAEIVSRHLGLFDETMATDESSGNLAGENKARALAEKFGERGFDYVGDSPADLPVWRRAREAVGVAPSPRLRREINFARVFASPRRSRMRVWISAARTRQWSKNLLLFAVLFGGHRWNEPGALLAALAGFFSFGFLASAAYFFNDILDLPHDRRSAEKRARPLAAGEVGVGAAALAGMLCLMAGTGIAWALPALLELRATEASGPGAVSLPQEMFPAVALLYFAMTVSYSLWLKRLPLVDVTILALLFTLRILAGGAAIGSGVSVWLLAFAVFLFLSLAMLKRVSEMRRNAGASPGRGYRPEDAPTLSALGGGAAMVSGMVLALYIDSEQARNLYSRPEFIWAALPIVVCWLSRMWLLGGRGEMRGDPLMFAMRDRPSVIAGALMLLCVLAAL